MTSQTNIQIALDTRLSQLLGAPDIDWPNTNYTPTVGRSWLRPTNLQAKADSAVLSAEQLLTGIYQIDIYVPLDQGQGHLLKLIDDITALYLNNLACPANGDIVYVQDVGRGLAQRSEAWYSCFVAVNYLCYS